MSATDTSAPAVEFLEADIGYEGRAVVRGLNLRIARGEVVAILGANGSGKSTIVRGMFGLARLSSGTVRLFGVDGGGFREWRRIGYVPQAHTIGGGVPSTVTEIVSSGRLSQVPPWRRFRSGDRQAVRDAIDAVGLGGHERSMVTHLSGGQQRRVLIARALVTEPELLVLDEPTAGVDAASQDALALTLRKLISAGSTIILIAHELGPVEPLVSRVVVMRNGATVFDGSRQEAPMAELGGDWHHLHGSAPSDRRNVGLAG